MSFTGSYTEAESDFKAKMASSDDATSRKDQSQGLVAETSPTVCADLKDAELPKGPTLQGVREEMYGTWWPVYSELLRNVDGQNSSSVMYSKSRGPATTLTIYWQGGNSYRNLAVSVDLPLTLEYRKSKLPVQLTKLSQKVNPVL